MRAAEPQNRAAEPQNDLATLEEEQGGPGGEQEGLGKQLFRSRAPGDAATVLIRSINNYLC